MRAEAARAEADEADRRRAAGERLPLLGVPVAIKDDMDLAGEPTTFGCAGDFHPRDADGEVVRRLRAAGAVIVGKTNTPEVGQWPFTEGPAFGATRNPWSLDHTPGRLLRRLGGRRRGGARARRRRLRRRRLGAHPRGLDPPRRHQAAARPHLHLAVPRAFNGLTCIGPLARTVDDAALLLDVLAGNQPEDLHRPPPPPEPFADAARPRARAAADRALDADPVRSRRRGWTRRCARQVERLARALEGLGHDVEQADPAYGLIGLELHAALDGRGTRVGRAARDRHAQLDPRTRGTIAARAALRRCCAPRTRSSARCTATSGGSSAASTSC